MRKKAVIALAIAEKKRMAADFQRVTMHSESHRRERLAMQSQIFDSQGVSWRGGPIILLHGVAALRFS